MPDPKDLPTGNPERDPLLDPAELPNGLKLDPANRDELLAMLADTGRHVTAETIPITPPPKPKPVTLLYPFLFLACPNWTYGLQARGDCMAWSAAHTIDVLTAVQIHPQRRREQWRALASIEALYGIMRVEVHGGRPDFSRDGANPADAAQAVTQFGVLHRLKYLDAAYDLTDYDTSGGRSGTYGRWGIPDRLEPIAKEHHCHDAALVTTFDDACKMIALGYPISNAAPDNPIYRSRDSHGTGQHHWAAAHAMNYIGYRLGQHPALLKVNWGHGNHVSGPIVPADMPPTLAACSAWEPAETCDAVLKTRWSFAYSDFLGFPARPLDQLPNAENQIHNPSTL
jgi:hypothetical protein